MQRLATRYLTLEVCLWPRLTLIRDNFLELDEKQQVLNMLSMRINLGHHIAQLHHPPRALFFASHLLYLLAVCCMLENEFPAMDATLFASFSWIASIRLFSSA